MEKVVTGSTWGIGYGFARELAKRKLNIVLIARTQARLEEVAREIEKEFGVKTLVIEADFAASNSFEIVYNKIGDAIQNLDVAVLVNNVGIAPDAAWFAHSILSLFLLKLIELGMRKILEKRLKKW